MNIVPSELEKYLHNISGNEGEVKKLLKNVDQNTDKKIYDVIYEWLAKYIDQMLAASVSRNTGGLESWLIKFFEF